MLHTRLALIAIVVSAPLSLGATPAGKQASPKPAPKAAAAKKSPRPALQPEIRHKGPDKPIDIKPVNTQGAQAPAPIPFEIRANGAEGLIVAYKTPKVGASWDKTKPFVIQLLAIDEPGVKLSPDVLTSDEWGPTSASVAVRIAGKPAKPPLSIAAKASYAECEAGKCAKRLRSWIQTVQP